MRNLVVVEDETLIRLGMKVMLDWSELGVRWAGDASNGNEALQIIEGAHVDIVITDIRMPEMNGIELMSICKEKHPHIRFIVLSSYSDFELARHALQLGAVDYILKPTLNIEDIKKAIIRAILTLPSADFHHKQGDTHDSDFVKELIIERLLLHEHPEWELEERKRFKVPIWQGNVSISYLTAIKNEEHDAKDRWVGSLLVILDDHIGALQIEKVKFHGSMLLFFHEATFSQEQWVTWKNNLFWKIKNVLGVDLYGDERFKLKSWKDIRHSLNELDLTMKRRNQEGMPSILVKAISYMQAHFCEPIGLEHIAEQVGVSPSYLSRLFKQEAGKSFVRHLYDLKLNRAKMLLLQRPMTAASVGEQIGYPNPRYFSKWFKALTGMTPGEFRRMNNKSE